jgi:hypothetical protein
VTAEGQDSLGRQFRKEVIQFGATPIHAELNKRFTLGHPNATWGM